MQRLPALVFEAGVERLANQRVREHVAIDTPIANQPGIRCILQGCQHGQRCIVGNATDRCEVE